jgi:hypothetical protein
MLLTPPFQRLVGPLVQLIADHDARQTVPRRGNVPKYMELLLFTLTKKLHSTFLQRPNAPHAAAENSATASDNCEQSLPSCIYDAISGSHCAQRVSAPQSHDTIRPHGPFYFQQRGVRHMAKPRTAMMHGKHAGQHVYAVRTLEAASLHRLWH